MDSVKNLPVAVIGAGPIGLAAAAVRLLEASGWAAPRLTALPYGGDLIDNYLAPLAATPEIDSRLQTGARVLAVTRQGMDKTHVRDRDTTPFTVRVEHDGGEVRDHTVAAVFDASGTWPTRNPLGTSGLPAMGEESAADRISSPLPDVTGRDRAAFAGGRAPTFLLATGYEQVRSVAAVLAGDQASADTVHLELPETGVCSTDVGTSCDVPTRIKTPAGQPVATEQREETYA
jgi:hypothetical protein